MTLKYPIDLEEPVLDYMVFTAHEYRTNKAYAGQQEGNEGGGEGPAMGEPIVLYMPNSTPGMLNGQAWAENRMEGELGMIARNAGISAGAGIMNIDPSGDGKAQGRALIDNIRRNVSEGVNKGPSALRQIGMNLVAPLVSTNASGLLAMQRGQVYNPNVELLYQSPGLRNFSFDFNFLPKSAIESQMVNRIIMEFKKWSSPSDIGNGVFKVPCIWKVQYMTGGKKNPNMNQFKKCALTGITVQANNGLNMHQAFADGMPVVTAINLQFMEVDIIVREDHEKAPNQGY